MNSPCKPDCPLRFEKCHAYCPFYVQYVEERQKGLEAEHKQSERITAELMYLCRNNLHRKK